MSTSPSFGLCFWSNTVFVLHNKYFCLKVKLIFGLKVMFEGFLLLLWFGLDGICPFYIPYERPGPAQHTPLCLQVNNIQMLLLSTLVSIGYTLLMTFGIYTVIYTLLYQTVVNHMGWKAIK